MTDRKSSNHIFIQMHRVPPFFTGRSMFRALFLGMCLAVFGCQSKDVGPPNFILFVADDMRWDIPGYSGNHVIHTPHIDRLAKTGIVFTRAYVTTSICSVSRASILSGQYGRRHGLWGFGAGFSDSAFQKSYPMVLRDGGYYTGYVGKYGVGPTKEYARQFDFWRGFEHQGTYYHRDSMGNPVHLTRLIGEQSIEFLAERDDSKPFLLVVGFKAPHVQDGAPPAPEKLFPADPAYAHEYADVEWSRPVAADTQYFDHFNRAFTEGNEARKRWVNRFSTEDRYDRSMEGYYGLVHGLDVSIGKILQEVEDQGLTDNTIVLFTSDNGFYLGEYGFAGKWYGSEPSVRVPLVICNPRTTEGAGSKTLDDLVLNIDIAPTIIDYAGLPVPPEMQGASLTQLLEGESAGWRQDFLYEHLWPLNTGYHIPSTEGIIGDRFKYMRYFNGFNPDTIIFEELYDLNTDPNELTNLISSEFHGELKDSLVRRLDVLLMRSAK